MAATLDDINSKLSSMESALSGIRKDAGGFNFVKDKNFDKKIDKVIKKAESIDKLKSIDKNIRNIEGNTKQSAKNRNIVSSVSAIEAHTKKIANFATTFSKPIKDAANFLDSISKHISSKPTVSVNNGNVKGISGRVTEITNTLNEIEKVVSSIHELLEGRSTTGDPKLDAILKANTGIKAREESFERRLKAFENGGVIYDEKTGKPIKKGTKKYKNEREKLLKERDSREREKQKEELKKKFSGTNLATGIINFGNDLISPNQKATASGLADKGIGAISKLGPAGMIAGAILQLIKSILELGSKIDRASSDFARTIGGGAFGKRNIGETVTNAIKAAPAGRGYTNDAAFSALTEIAESRGRTTERLSTGSTLSAIDLKRFGIGGEAISNFDSFGKSIEETDKYFAKLYSEVSKKGLSFKNVSKAVNDNLKMAQKYGFQNGIEGINKMAEKSTQLKYNMQQVFQLAEKVNTVEGSIDVASKLSVLGSSFAQYSNPMQMLYEGLNDMEALQNRLEKTFSGKAFWNSETGQIDMSAMDKRFVREAANAMGISAEEMLNMSFNQARRDMVKKQIGTGVGKDTAEYIQNIAEIGNDGVARVTLNGQTKAVSSLSEADKSALEKESAAKDKASGAKLGDIYSQTMSIGERMDNILQYLKEWIGANVYKIFKLMAGREAIRQEIAQGEGDEEIRSKRLELYNELIKNGGNKGRIAKEVSKYDLVDIERRMPQSPNGFSPTFRKPGNSGILVGNSHENGGIKGIRNGIAWEAEGGEFLINKNSSSRYHNELTKIQNGTFNPYSYSNELIKNNMAEHFKQVNVNPTNKQLQQNSQQPANVPINGTIKIDIPQTITINLSGGEKIGDYDISGVIMKYVDKFIKEAIVRENRGGFDKENFYNKSIVI